MKRIASITSIFPALLVSSCKHDLPIAISDLNGRTGLIETTIIIPAVGNIICFESQILPLFVSLCAKSDFHDANTEKKDLTLTNYQAIMDGINANYASDSEFLQVMLLPQSNEDAMGTALNAPMIQEQIALITQWINQGAHNTTNYSFTLNDFSFMPQNQPKIDICFRTKIQKWVLAGSPNN